MCLFPKLIINRKYTPTKKNGYKPQVIKDERTKYVPVGCGNCIECKKQYARQWKVRLNEEIKGQQNGKFITLTFSEEWLSILQEIWNKQYKIDKSEENEIATLAVRRFLERWRKKYKKSLRHWLVTELGHTNTERIHLHGILWTDKDADIAKIWQYGFVTIGNGLQNYVNEKSINYIVKYITKVDELHPGYKAKILTSPGIGNRYTQTIDSRINKYQDKQTEEYYRTKSGIKLNLPIYYRNKLYDDNQREQLWLNRLDQNTRYICGEKIDISKSYETYDKTLEYYRRINRRLGFGDDSKNWDKDKYKQDRKRIQINKKNDKNQLGNSEN